MVWEVMTVKVPDSIRGSALSEALEWAKRFTKYVREKWPATDARLLTNVNGEFGRLHWVFELRSMAEQEKWTAELAQDKGYQSLINELVAAEEKKGGHPFLTQITLNFYNVVDLG
jgi:hypothetical protein